MVRMSSGIFPSCFNMHCFFLVYKFFMFVLMKKVHCLFHGCHLLWTPRDPPFRFPSTQSGGQEASNPMGSPAIGHPHDIQHCHRPASTPIILLITGRHLSFYVHGVGGAEDGGRLRLAQRGRAFWPLIFLSLSFSKQKIITKAIRKMRLANKMIIHSHLQQPKLWLMPQLFLNHVYDLQRYGIDPQSKFKIFISGHCPSRSRKSHSLLGEIGEHVVLGWFMGYMAWRPLTLGVASVFVLLSLGKLAPKRTTLAGALPFTKSIRPLIEKGRR